MISSITQEILDSVVVEASSIDVDHVGLFKKPWLLVLESGKIFQCDTEKEAFDKQLYFLKS